MKVSILADGLQDGGLAAVLLVQVRCVEVEVVLRVSRAQLWPRHFLVVRVVHIWIWFPIVPKRLPN